MHICICMHSTLFFFFSDPYRFVPSSDTNSITSLNSFGSSGGSSVHSVQEPVADSPPAKWGGGGGGDNGPMPLDTYFDQILVS